MQKTFMAKKETHEDEWFLIDASNQTVGRLATRVASILRGKHKPTFTPHFDAGDYVIITNVEKVLFSGKKMNQKIYYSHSGHPGGLKKRLAKDVLENHPDRILGHAIKGMLPKGPLGRKMYKKLFLYVGDEHNHDAQKPTKLEL